MTGISLGKYLAGLAGGFKCKNNQLIGLLARQVTGLKQEDGDTFLTVAGAEYVRIHRLSDRVARQNGRRYVVSVL